jgi:predicted membrane-bound mannosyltransferase
MTRGFWPALMVFAIVALALRWPQLDRRPMHGDEAVHAVKFRGLWESGVYQYDPNEYHGPMLYYATLPVVWLSCATDFADLNESTLRFVAVIFGVGLVLLLGFLRDALGGEETLCAAALTAVSPAMVFYSRYYIHELPLVFFTLLFLAGTWRYARSPRLGWALVAGTSLGLMHATKETSVIALAAMTLALIAAVIYGRWRDPAHRPFRLNLKLAHGLAALGVALVVSVALFSSFLTNPRGPLDSVRTYLPWLNRTGLEASSPFSVADIKDLPSLVAKLQRGPEPVSQFLWNQCSAESKRLLIDPNSTSQQQQSVLVEELNKILQGNSIYNTQRFAHVALRAATRVLAAQNPTGAKVLRLNRLLVEDTYPLEVARESPSPHLHPWYFYFERLFYFHHGFGPVWSEGLILGLALVGLVVALRHAQAPEPRTVWLRFVGFYTVVLTMAYSLIAYKTPWCALGFLHGMILLAGVGAIALIRLFQSRWLKLGLGAGLVLATAQLGLQAWRSSFVLYEDRRNPYVYAHAVSDVRELADRVEGLTRTQPRRHPVLIAVASPGSDYWPLPWYFRRLNQVGWYSDLTTAPDADVFVASPKFKTALDAKLGKTHRMVGFFGLRPGTFLQLFVRSDLWRDYVERAQAAH